MLSEMELPLTRFPMVDSAVEMLTPARVLNLMMLPAAPPIWLFEAPVIEIP